MKTIWIVTTMIIAISGCENASPNLADITRNTTGGKYFEYLGFFTKDDVNRPRVITQDYIAIVDDEKRTITFSGPQYVIEDDRFKAGTDGISMDFSVRLPNNVGGATTVLYDKTHHGQVKYADEPLTYIVGTFEVRFFDDNPPPIEYTLLWKVID